MKRLKLLHSVVNENESCTVHTATREESEEEKKDRNVYWTEKTQKDGVQVSNSTQQEDKREGAPLRK